ncbi:uncharacterized protein [Macrobrachium rosenbergii]|uniref:uncharacterized protein n=1 Tax=Macrobrachium rosenbergii TaxID=79674 RepID=UPI0034D48728
MNAVQIILIFGVLCAATLAAPQRDISRDSETVKSALELTPVVLEQFTRIANQGNFRGSSVTMSPEESERNILRLLEASVTTVEESKKRGFDVPDSAKEDLETAKSLIPATFKLFSDLRRISGS